MSGHTSFFTREELEQIGFGSLGLDVLISRHAKLYGAQKIFIGNHVRIDDFCVLSAGDAGIEFGNYVHIACFSCVFGQAGVRFSDFSGISSRVAIYSESDDYLGEGMTNPTIPLDLRETTSAEVVIGRHAVVGAGSTILPGAHLGEGAAVGAMSLVTKPCKPWYIYFGIPAKPVRARGRRILELEQRLVA